MYFARPIEALNAYMLNPESTIIFGTDVLLRKNSAEMPASANDQDPPGAPAQDRRFSAGGVSTKTSWTKSYSSVLFSVLIAYSWGHSNDKQLVSRGRDVPPKIDDPVVRTCPSNIYGAH